MAQNPFRYGSIEYDNWNYEHPGVADPNDAVTKAKTAIADASDFGAVHNTERLAKLPESLAALRALTEDKRGITRRITEPLAGAGNLALGAALPAGAVNPTIGGAMGVGGGLALLPDYLRRLIAPEEGEEGPGALETAGTALAAIPAARASMKGLQALKKAPAAMGPLGDIAGADMMGGRALAFEGGAGARPAGRAAVATPRPPMKPPTIYAKDALSNPSSEAFMTREFNANKPIADRVFGRNLDLMGRSKEPPFESAWAQARREVSGAREVDLTGALDDIAMKPKRPAVSALEQLMGAPAFEGLPQGQVAMPPRAPRPSRARPVGQKPAAGEKTQRQLNEEALARRRKK